MMKSNEVNPYFVSMHPQHTFSTSPHGEVYTDVKLPGFLKKVKDKVQDKYEKSALSWKPKAQQFWNAFIQAIRECRTQPSMSEEQKELNNYKKYEMLDSLDIAIIEWLNVKQDLESVERTDRTLTSKEGEFLQENIASLEKEEKQWLLEILPRMKNGWWDMWHAHYQRDGDRFRRHTRMNRKYPNVIDFILGMLNAAND